MNTWTLLDDPPDEPREYRIDRLRREYMESHFRALWVVLGEMEEDEDGFTASAMARTAILIAAILWAGGIW